MIFVSLPFSLENSYVALTFSAKHVKYLFAATHAAAASFCYVLAWLCNLDTDAIIGVPVGILVVLVSGALAAFYTELFAWPVVTIWCFLIIITTVLQMIASLTPLNLGVLSLIPGFVTAVPSEQFVWQMCMFTLLAVGTFLFIERYSPATRQTVNCMNIQSAFIASYFFIGGCSYLFVLIGLSNASALDPIGLFSIPSSFKVLLTAAGWRVQTKREKALRRCASTRPLIEEMQSFDPGRTAAGDATAAVTRLISRTMA